MIHSILLTLHVSAGILGVLTGAVALFFLKGSRGHRLSGLFFVAAMLCMAGCGAILAVMKSQPTNVCAGVLTFYMILTAWFTARRTEQAKTGIYDWVGLLIGLAVGISITTMGIRVVTGASPPIDNAPTPAFFIMGGIALLSSAGDLRMIVRGSMAGKQRLIRHLWRMCFGLFIATGSFFLGQQQVFPAFLRGSTLLVVLGFLPLPVLFYWLLRVRLSKSYRRKVTVPGVAAQPSLSS
jgi:uncharacterized membrane protein